MSLHHWVQSGFQFSSWLKFVIAHCLGRKVKVSSSAKSSKRLIGLLFGQVTLAQVLCFGFCRGLFVQGLNIGLVSVYKGAGQSLSVGHVGFNLQSRFFG